MSAPRIARTLPPRPAHRLAFFCRAASTSSSTAAPSATASRLVSRPAAAAKATATTAPRLARAARPLHAYSRSTAAPAPTRPAAAATRSTDGGGASAASDADAAAADAGAAGIPEAGSLASSSPAPAAASAPFASPDPSSPSVDWASSFHGLSTTPFAADVATVLMAPIDPQDVEIKPDGILYLPEIKYRRILNLAFGPGGWGLAPRGDLAVGDKVVSREYALVVHGRFVGQARGECGYFGGGDSVVTAGEGCKSNALMRCCKDLGIASELWDPRFIRQFKQQHCREVWVEHVATKKKRQIWLRKDCPPAYPFALPSSTTGSRAAAAAR